MPLTTPAFESFSTYSYAQWSAAISLYKAGDVVSPLNVPAGFVFEFVRLPELPPLEGFEGRGALSSIKSQISLSVSKTSEL